MNRRAVTPYQAPPRVIHYASPATDPYADLMRYTGAELAARRHDDAVLYARWIARQAQIAERDRRTRRFMVGFGAAVAVALLTGCGVAGWLVYRAVTAAAGIPVAGLIVGAVFLLGATVAGGRACVTVVQHRH